MPKPMLPVAGRPFLEHLFDQVTSQGAEEIHIVAGFLGSMILDRYQGRRWHNARLYVTVEDAPAGTGGCLHALAGRLESVFLLMNGDSYFACGLDWAVPATLRPGALGQIALRREADASGYGAAVLEPDGRLARFAEKVPGRDRLVNAGLYLLRDAFLAEVPPPPCSLEHDVFPPLVARGLLQGQVFEGYFIDIGVPDRYAQADRDLVSIGPGRQTGSPV